MNVTLQGHDRHGWDTETVGTMEEVHAYLLHPHRGPVTVYIEGVGHVLPRGIGRRCE